MNKDNKQDNVVVITGAGSGLGRELARKYYEEGFIVCLIGRRTEKLQETASGFHPKRHLCLSCDIRDYHEVRKTFKKIKNTYKQIDILINNAGIFTMLSISQTTPKIWDNILKTNAYGAFYCTKQSVSIMGKSKSGGKIINILSIVTEKDLPFNSAYAASKYAIKGLMKSLQEELKGKNIQIINISPGRIDTGIWNKKYTDKLKKEKSLSSVKLAKKIYNL